MADINKTIEIIFGAQDKGVQSTVSNISSSLSVLDDGVHRITGPIADVTTTLLKTEAAIIATGLAATALAVNFAGEFTTSVAEVGTLMNLNADQNRELAQTLIDYSRDAAVGLNDIVQASYIAISTGTSLANVTTQLAAAEQLAVAGATNLATATGALSRTMNAYGFEAEEADRVSNALFITVQNGDTTMEQLAVTIGRVASIAANSNVPLETLLSSIAAITVAGIKTTEAVTGMSALFKELAKPSTELTDALGGMSLQTHSLEEIMGKLKEVTNGEFDAVTNLFGSIEATNVAVVLINDSMGSFKDTLIAMETETQALEQAYGVMEETFSRVNQNLVNNIKATLIEAGIPLLDEYGSAIQALSGIFKGIGEGLSSPNFDVVYAAIEQFVIETTALLDGMAEALPEAFAQLDLTGVTTAFSELKDTVLDVFSSIFGADLDLTKPEDLAKILQKVINAITAMTQITGAVINEFKTIFAAIGEAINKTQGLDDKTLKIVGEIGALAIQIETFGILMTGALKTINETGANIGDVFNVVIGAGKAVVNSFQILFDGIVFIVVDAIATMFELADKSTPDFLQTFDFGKQAEDFRLIANGVKENLVRNLDDMEAAGRQMTSGLSGEMSKAASSVEAVGTAAGVAGGNVSRASTVMQLSVEGLPEAWDGVRFALIDYLVAIDDYNDGAQEAIITAQKFAGANQEAGESFREYQTRLDEADGALDGFIKTEKDGITVYEQTQTGLANVNRELSNTAKEADTAESEVNELELTLLELASNERIASMEFTASINIANIEAQAKVAVSIIDGLSQSIQSADDLIASLFGQDAPDWDRFGFETQNQINLANDRQEENLKLQKKLIAAQVNLMNAQADALFADDIDIVITADGLEPEIEAFMFKILDRIRVKVAANKASFLMGVV